MRTGCSNKASVAEVGVFKAEDIPFEDGSGRVTIAFKDITLDDSAIIEGIIDVIILANSREVPKNK